jgi:hypothetical protein
MVANGQIPLDRFNVDMLAVKLAVRLLREGASSRSTPRALAVRATHAM